MTKWAAIVFACTIGLPGLRIIPPGRPGRRGYAGFETPEVPAVRVHRCELLVPGAAALVLRFRVRVKRRMQRCRARYLRVG